MSRRRGRVLRALSVAMLAVLLVFAAFYAFLFVRCFGAERRVPTLGEVAIMRVILYGSSGETVSARFALLDTSGREFAVLDRSWTGSVLSVEFTSAAFGGREFMFPLRICSEQYLPFGRSRVFRGTPLPRYYIYDGGCAFLDPRFPAEAREALRALADFAVWQSTKFQSSRSRVVTLNLAPLEKGVSYDILSDPASGSLRLART